MSLPNGSCLHTKIKNGGSYQLKESDGCHVCKSEKLFFLDGFSNLPRASSDCGPWPNGGDLCVCPQCFTVQKHINSSWKKEVKSIYEKYNLYHQSSTQEEQPVFDEETGTLKARSVKLLEDIIKKFPELPTKGRILDVGCGTGAFLKAFSSVFKSGWSLYGFEPNAHSVENLLKIKNVKNIFQKIWQKLY